MVTQRVSVSPSTPHLEGKGNGGRAEGTNGRLVFHQVGQRDGGMDGWSSQAQWDLHFRINIWHPSSSSSSCPTSSSSSSCSSSSPVYCDNNSSTCPPTGLPHQPLPRTHFICPPVNWLSPTRLNLVSTGPLFSDCPPPKSTDPRQRERERDGETKAGYNYHPDPRTV